MSPQPVCCMYPVVSVAAVAAAAVVVVVVVPWHFSEMLCMACTYSYRDASEVHNGQKRSTNIWSKFIWEWTTVNMVLNKTDSLYPIQSDDSKETKQIRKGAVKNVQFVGVQWMGIEHISAESYRVFKQIKRTHIHMCKYIWYMVRFVMARLHACDAKPIQLDPTRPDSKNVCCVHRECVRQNDAYFDV